VTSKQHLKSPAYGNELLAVDAHFPYYYNNKRQKLKVYNDV